MSLYGKEGFHELALACHSKAEYLKTKLGVAKVITSGPTFNEFAVRLPTNAGEVVTAMAARGFHAGIPLEPLGAGGPNDLLIAVTERRTRDQLDAFASALQEAACS
jgi:glycine dehydrogenase subunit 1